MASLDIKSVKGDVLGQHSVGEALANATPSMTTLHRAIVAEEANKRQGTQKTKTRAETRGGGRKPYKQKKTGNARQGSIRSPHYAHGGMALALSPRDYEKKVNRRERRAAIVGALSAHIEAGNVQVVDNLVFAEPKTKDATAFLEAFGLKGERRILVILESYDLPTYKSFRNLPNVEVRTAPAGKGDDTKTQAFSARDLMVARNIVVVQGALTKIEEVWAQ